MQGYQYEDDDEIGVGEGNEEDQYQTQILDVNAMQPVATFDKLQQIEDLDNYEDDLDDQESDVDDDEDQELIIINQQQMSDENKIIYMSNINSCSLP